MELYPKRSLEAYGGYGAGRTGPPPATDNLLYWLDFSDPTVMWADTDGTGAVADGGDIARVDNKGSVSTHWLEATVAERPHRNALGYADFTSKTHGLNINADPSMTGGASTVAFLGMTEDADVNVSHYAGKLALLFTTACLVLLGDGSGTVDRALAYSGGGSYEPQNPATTVGLGTVVSVILPSDNRGSFAHASWDPNASGKIALHDNITKFQVGYNAAIATDGWGGKFGAVLVWDKALNDVEIADLKAYDKAKWGTVWA